MILLDFDFIEGSITWGGKCMLKHTKIKPSSSFLCDLGAVTSPIK